jgi:hypothetical protein
MLAGRTWERTYAPASIPESGRLVAWDEATSVADRPHTRQPAPTGNARGSPQFKA